MNALTSKCEACAPDCRLCRDRREKCLACSDARVDLPPFCPCRAGERPALGGRCERVCAIDSFMDAALYTADGSNVDQPCTLCSRAIPNCSSCTD